MRCSDHACSAPATTIFAVHKGLHVLDTVPHTLLSIEIADPFVVHVVDPAAIPNPNWLRPGTPSAGQQQFGDAVLAANPMALFPSVVSQHSWNLLLDVDAAAGSFQLHGAEAFALDPRLNPLSGTAPSPGRHLRPRGWSARLVGSSSLGPLLAPVAHPQPPEYFMGWWRS